MATTTLLERPPSRVAAGGRSNNSLGSSRRVAGVEGSSEPHERQFNVFLCESQKWLVVAQCVYYSVFIAANVIEFGVHNEALSRLDDAFWAALDGRTQAEARAYVQHIVTVTAAFGVMKIAQLGMFVCAAVLVHRRYYQERWTLYSTILLVLGSVVGPVPLGLWTTATISNAALINASAEVPLGVVRGLVLDTLITGTTWRFTGLSGLQLLAFAPRFLPFLVASVVLGVTETIGEALILMAKVEAIEGNSTVWTTFMGLNTYSNYGGIIYNNLTTYIIPAGVLWLFERMLHNRFLLQKTLELRSSDLYKQANPFALTTMQDWVEQLTAASAAGPDGIDHPDDASSRRGSATKPAPTSYHQAVPMRPLPRHPWQLDERDLRLADVIGSGSHGQVYRGAYKGSEVAVKTLFVLDPNSGGPADAEALAETAAEAGALSQLRHANMMRFYGVCFLAEQRSVAMVTELCATDLRAWIDADPGAGRPVAETAGVAVQVARGLVYLHEDAKMVHRDLKPQNLLLTAAGVVKMADFGISAVPPARTAAANGGSGGAASAAAAVSAAGAEGVVAVDATGTTEYMAPECFALPFQRQYTGVSARGEGGAADRAAGTSHRGGSGGIVGDGGGGVLAALRPVDVYATGCILWELFAARQVWTDEGYGRFDVIRAVERGERPNVAAARFGTVADDGGGSGARGTPGGGGTHGDRLRALVAAAWAQDATRRPRARQMCVVLEDILEQHNHAAATAAAAAAAAEAGGRPAARAATRGAVVAGPAL